MLVEGPFQSDNGLMPFPSDALPPSADTSMEGQSDSSGSIPITDGFMLDSRIKRSKVSKVLFQDFCFIIVKSPFLFLYRSYHMIRNKATCHIPGTFRREYDVLTDEKIVVKWH